MLNWSKQFNIFCYLDNQQYWHEDGYECLLAVNALRYIDDSLPFHEIKSFLSPGNWYFGHLSYDLKNELYGFESRKTDKIGFSLFYFFQPEILVFVKGNQLIIEAPQPDHVYRAIIDTSANHSAGSGIINLQQAIQKEEYIALIKKLQEHILKGDCYEINYCLQFFADEVSIDPNFLFQRLIETSPTPFSALYKLNQRYLLCASPERFIKRTGAKIFSQPMKGTARRDLANKAVDEQLKNSLLKDVKEKAENVMVVDLVRNDLSKICKEATVKVEELFGVYTFPQVHQMVSTISGELKDGISMYDILFAMFPMGSMTGAPKHKVMQLIEKYEPVNRGLFSGSVGYINPDGDFDFNVVIRSILYHEEQKYLSYYAGSGITFYSDAEKEWEECLLKGEVIKKVLTQ